MTPMRKPWHRPLRALGIVGIAVLAFGIVRFAWVANLSNGTSFRSDPLAKLPPSIGNMGGTKLSIPHNYLLSSVVYDGDEQWKLNNRTTAPTFASKIKYFDLILRVSNFKPISTQEDWNDYLLSGKTVHPGFFETWITVGVDQRLYRTDGRLQSMVNEWQHGMHGAWPPINRPDGLQFGLQHYQTTGKVAWTPDEIFFDDHDWHTFISCETVKMVVPPYNSFSNCKHRFVIPELRAVAEADYSKQELSRWREIEANVHNIINSFVVN